MKQSTYLSILTQAPAGEVKQFADSLLAQVEHVEVLSNRTGLVMLPYTDSVQGSTFHLGEVLVAEAHVQLDEQEGYASVLGRDLEQALAVAILDGLMQADRFQSEIEAFVVQQGEALASQEEALLRQVEATRVEMETF